MKLRLLATVSLLANAGLVAFILWAGRGSASETVGGDSASSRAALQANRLKTNLTRIEVTLTNAASPFHWRDVASEDFKQYAANLRAIACPPETVKDIIKAELTTLFLAKRRPIVEPFQREYWNIAARGGELDDEMKPYEEAVRKLSEQTLGKLDDCLGDSGESKPAARRRFDPETTFLPEEKQKALEELHERFNKDFAKLNRDHHSKLTPEQRAQRDALDKQRWESAATLLTPEENAEYQLRRSRNAREAQASTGFEGTPEEARAIAQAYEQFKDPQDRLNPKDPDYAAKQSAAAEIRRQREEAMKSALGPERYAQFKQGFDGDFRDVHRITERYGLSRDAATQAADVLRAQREAMKKLQADKAMLAEERAQRELAAREATRAALLQALGERALRTYENYHGPIVPIPEPEF